MKAETAKTKADKMLKKGDAAGNTAEGRRLLRACRRWRKKQRECEQGESS